MLRGLQIDSIITTLIVTIVASTCRLTAGGNDKYLFKLGEEEFYADEFEYYFFKNNGELIPDSLRGEVKEYLELYVNFRLKVKEALAQKRDEDPAFIEEFNGYKRQLLKPFMAESKISEQLVIDTYDRMKEERLASHILLKVAEDAAPEDTLQRYMQLVKLKSRAEAGENFDSLAFEYSEDPSARINYGNLGYFSAMQMVYPFEEATFKAAVGDIVGPIRTKFGYHIIQVNDVRPSRGKIRVAHIMVRVDNDDQKSFDLAYNKALSIYNKATGGEDWDELCLFHSEDMNTKKKGGVLNWIGTGSLIKEFEDAAFGLDTIGSISEPVKTRFGWHVIKLLEKKGIEPFEKVKPRLENRLSREAGSRLKREKALAKIKQENGFESNDQMKIYALSQLDSTLLDGKWNPDNSDPNKSNVLFSIGSRTYKVEDFWGFVKSRHRKRSHSNLDSYRHHLYNRFEEKSIFDFEEENLSKTNFDYQMILQEYRNGILLFNLMEEEVWQKAVNDTLGQKKYYDGHKEDYFRHEKAEVRIFASTDENTIVKVRKYYNRPKSELDSLFNSEEPLNLQVLDKSVSRGEDPVIDEVWSMGLHELSVEGKFYLIYVKEIIPTGTKPFEKVRGAVISDYQKELEDRWVESLKSKYPVKLNKGSLKRVINNFEARL